MNVMNDGYDFSENISDDDFFQVVDEVEDEDEDIVDVDYKEIDDESETEPEVDTEEKSKQDIEKVRKLVKQSIKQLSTMNDLPAYLKNQIYATYNTSCVDPMDLLELTKDNDNADLELYEQPIYSLILNIEEDWVAELVDSIRYDWETSEEVNEYVNSYLRGLGVPDEDMDINKEALLTVLPDVLRDESSPVQYKYYRAVQLLCNDPNKNKEVDYEKAILEETDRLLDYASTLSNKIEDGVPFSAAEAMATEEVVRNMPDDSPVKKSITADSVAAGVGGFCGKVVKLKYSVSQSFDEALHEGLGEYAEDWDDTLSKIKDKQREKREHREIVKQERKEARDEAKQRQPELAMEEAKHVEVNHKQHTDADDLGGRALKHRRDASYDNRYYGQNDYYNQRNYNQYKRGYKQQNYGYRQQVNRGRDFAPAIPPAFLAIGFNVILALLCLLLFGSRYGTFSIIGLVIASFGFIKTKLNEDNAIPMIIIGYIIFIIALILAL